MSMTRMTTPSGNYLARPGSALAVAHYASAIHATDRRALQEDSRQGSVSAKIKIQKVADKGQTAEKASSAKIYQCG
jgi:hypothetical protein